MQDQKYILRHLADIFHTGVFFFQESQMISYEESPEYNPIYNNEALRVKLTCNTGKQKEPVIIKDDFQVFYLCVRKENAYYMMGPLSTQVMGRTERHRFYRSHGVDEKWEKGLHYYTLMEILQITGLFAKIITEEEYTDQQLVDANYHTLESAENERKEQIWFDIKSEDEDIYRHTYQEERRILDAVKEGDVKKPSDYRKKWM